MENARHEERCQEHVQLDGSGPEEFKRAEHADDDGHVFGEVCVSADGCTQCGIAAVAETDAIAAAHADHTYAEGGVDQRKHGQVRRRDGWSVHASPPLLVHCQTWRL